MDKVAHSPKEAISSVKDGAIIALSGFGLSHGIASSLIVATRDKGIKDLTIVCNSLGSAGSVRAQMLVQSHQVKKLICAFTERPGLRDPSTDQIEDGEIEAELVPQGILVERLRAAGAGLAAFYSPTGIGTYVAEGKDLRFFDNKPYVLEHALPVDFAYCRAKRADRYGNTQFHGSNIHFNISMAKAAKVTIMEVDEIVEPGEIDPDEVGLPGIFVTIVVQNTVQVDGSEGTMRMRRPLDVPRVYNDKPAWTRLEMAQVIADFLPDGSYVNLGTGMPALVTKCINGRDLTLHGENGLLGYAGVAEGNDIDPDVFDAGGNQVLPGPGAAYFDSVTSFELARGGRLDAVVLGGYQVDEKANFANYSLGKPIMGGIGGAMDLIAGKKLLVAMLEHRDSKDRAKLVKSSKFPLTGVSCVDVIVTDLCVMRFRDGHFVLEKIASGFSPDEVISLTEMTNVEVDPALQVS